MHPAPRGTQCYLTIMKPALVFRKEIQQHVAVHQDRQPQPRVSCIISAVESFPVPRPSFGLSDLFLSRMASQISRVEGPLFRRGIQPRYLAAGQTGCETPAE